MSPIQWLMVGGSAHGQTFWIKYGGRVRVGDETYQGQNYLHCGRLYRVGFINPDDLAADVVGQLIRKTGVKHIAGT